MIQPDAADDDLRPLLRTLASLAIAVIIVAIVYYGREVLLPVSLSVLLGFVLAPPVDLLRRLRLPRALAVIMVVLVAFAMLFAIGGIFARQVRQLADELPGYQTTISKKIEFFHETGAARGTLERANGILKGLGEELDGKDGNRRRTAATSQVKDDSAKPLPVEVRQPEPSALESLRLLIAPLVHPLATTGITIIFSIFILLQREDLRDRMIRLAGSRDLHRTTAALDDAAKRLSRFFLIQLAVNSLFGVVICAGLWIIGIPNPVLWGILAAVLRFVPYVGAPAAALFPLILATAVDPDWSMFLWTLALFVVVEPLVGHVIEPMVYGRSTGLSPIAIIVSATFWAAVWGPVGLILATPLTVCLVVLGRHVERLKFLDIMFGDRPALTPPQIFYHRMLANDPAEAIAQAEKFVKERPMAFYFDEIALKGLQLAQHDVESGNVTPERLSRIQETVREICVDLGELDDITQPTTAVSTTDPETFSAVAATDQTVDKELPPRTLKEQDLPVGWRSGTPIICFTGRGPLDEAAATLLSTLLDVHGLPARVQSANDLSVSNIKTDSDNAIAVACLVTLETDGLAYARFSMRRLRRRFPDARYLLVSLGDAAERNGAVDARPGGADETSRTLIGAVTKVIAELDRTAREDGSQSNEDP